MRKLIGEESKKVWIERQTEGKYMDKDEGQKEEEFSERRKLPYQSLPSLRQWYGNEYSR